MMDYLISLGGELFKEYGNGTPDYVLLQCLDTVRWMLDARLANTNSPQRWIYGRKKPIKYFRYQTAIFQYSRMNVGWQHRTWGKTQWTKDYPWLLRFLERMATSLEVLSGQISSHMGEDVKPIHFDFSLVRKRAISPRMSPKSESNWNACSATVFI